MNCTNLGSWSSIQGFCFDQYDNIYLKNSSIYLAELKYIKTKGSSNVLDKEIAYPPTGYENWKYGGHPTFINGRFAAIFHYNWNKTPASYLVEYNSFDKDDLYRVTPLPTLGLGEIPRWFQYDPINNLIVGVCTGYYYGYKDFIFIYDYATGLPLDHGYTYPGIFGRLYPYANGGYLYGFIDYYNKLMYCGSYTDAARKFYWFNYLTTYSTTTVYPTGYVDGFDSYEWARYGSAIDVHGNMWFNDWPPPPGESGYGVWLHRFYGITSEAYPRIVYV